MSIPNKIYIPAYPNELTEGVHLGDDWMYEPHKLAEFNVEYIRADIITEEQLTTLKNVAYGTYQNGDGPALRELYNTLKDLITK